MRYTDIAIIGGGLAGSTAAAMLGRAGIPAVLIDPHTVYPPDFRCEKLRRRPARSVAQDRTCRCNLARDHARRRSLESALRICRRQEAERPVRHHVRHAGQHHAGANSAGRRRRSIAKVIAIANSAGAAEARAVQRRGNLGAAGRARQRPERRPAPYARHRAPGRQRMPFDHARIRPRAGRPPGLRLSGADLLVGTDERPHGLSDAVSDRRRRCAPI